YTVFQALREQGVSLEGVLLKPSMVLPGTIAPRRASVADVAQATVRCLLRTVPAAVPGIVFLSGGQADEIATAHLDAMSRLPGPQPWPLSFSYARALQASPLKAWGGDPARVADAQRAFYHRARCISAARSGAYTPELERSVAESLRRLDVSYLLTIGGDDTASGAAAVALAFDGKLAVAHVPKTIDNDLPLPLGIPTFGFTTAVDVGKDLVRNLMKDAATTDKWFFVTIMGRHAGHLALGIGSAAGATLTVIGEEFSEGAVPLDGIAGIVEGAIIKRRVG